MKVKFNHVAKLPFDFPGQKNAFSSSVNQSNKRELTIRLTTLMAGSIIRSASPEDPPSGKTFWVDAYKYVYKLDTLLAF